jgi:ubiquinone/menaquinone biosynthesis C-methylase UbiE
VKKLANQPHEKTFDGYASDYERIVEENFKIVTNDISYFTGYKVEYLRLKHLSPKRILDFGCGIGKAENFLKQAFPGAELWGCDVSEESLHAARKSHPDVQFFSVANPVDMERHSGMFDLIFISCVFHHIVPEERLSWLESLAKSLSSNGKIAVFEVNPYNPVARHFVATCVFDAGVTLLSLPKCKSLIAEAGLTCISSQYTFFFPWRKPFLNNLERFLTWLPLGGQYCVLAQKAGAEGPEPVTVCE